MQLDHTRDSLLTEFGKATLKDRYLLPGEGFQEGFWRAVSAFASNNEHAERLYNYVSKLWLSLSTPILSNGGTTRGMPISCFSSWVDDTRTAILDHVSEVSWLSSFGGGTAGYWGELRSNGTGTSHGTKSTGIIPFIKMIESATLAFQQGGVRRGGYAAYLDISHPEIVEFINFRKPTGGDQNRKCLELHHGVCIPDAFMHAVENDLYWDLVDPHTKEIKEVLRARDLFSQLLELRIKTGEPYFLFVDTVQRAQHPSHVAQGLLCKHSNLCSEITLPTNHERTFVCCLSSLNLEKWDEWKDDEQFIDDVIEFLDNVLEYFIQNAPPQLQKAKKAAMMERSLGLGTLGWYSLLQSKMIPFEGPLAVGLNKKIFSHIKDKAHQATQRLAKERGPAPDWEAHPIGVPVRNMHLIAIAPNASSSIICGETSPSVEPWKANVFVHKTKSGSFLVKNKHLEKLLTEKGKNTQDVWQTIIENEGSVQHLEFLNDWEKSVFKTALEIDQHWIIQHAADRQSYVCQAQSINLFFPADVEIDYLLSVHYQAWKKGLKSLYYLRSTTLKTVDKVNQKIERTFKAEYSDDSDDNDKECFACSA